MIKFFKYFSTLFVVIFAAAFFLHPKATQASFMANNIMDDKVFDSLSQQSAASPGAIDSWLNQFPGSCISVHNGYTFNDPIGYTPTRGFLYGGRVSAGQVLYDTGNAYGINPQVLIVTLQKEQSLVTGSAGCSNLQYAGAMGYGCPDSGTTHSYPAEGALLTPLFYHNNDYVNSIDGTCVKSVSMVGFSEQIIHAAWLLKFGEQRSEGNTGWNVQLTNSPQPGDSWNNSDDPETCYSYGPMTQGNFKRCSSDPNPFPYDGYFTIDNTTVHMDNGATAALYWYTPHFHGNQNFVALYEGWFGSTHALDYSAQPVWQAVYKDSSKAQMIGWNAYMIPNQNAWAVVMMKNTGNITWTKGGGANDVRLATYSWGRISNFCAGLWIYTVPNCTRAAGLDESSVPPGAIGTFEFNLNAPTGINLYNETFGLVVDGKGTFNNGMMNFQINVVPPIYAAQPAWQAVYTDKTKSQLLGWNASIQTGHNAWAVVTMTNTSNFTWTKGGPYDVRLATFNPWGRISNFCAGLWIYTSPNCTRPATFDEPSVPPWTNATFEFNLNAPTGINTYNESYGLVVDGKSTFVRGFVNFQLTVTR